MNKTLEILRKLRPAGGWVLTGEDFDSIQWIEAIPISQIDYAKELLTIEDFVISKNLSEVEAISTAKAALLKRLGITADEAALLLS